MKYLSDTPGRSPPPKPQMESSKANSLLIVGFVIGAAFLAYEVRAIMS